MKKNRALTYHGQAEVDLFAKQEDRTITLPTTSFKQIKEAYEELMSDLILESQEAY